MAARPSITGMRTSISTKSKAPAATASRASWPSRASVVSQSAACSMMRRRSRLAGWSSTISTLIRPSSRGASASRAAAATTSAGRIRVKVVPVHWTLSTPIVPPRRSMWVLARARPTPAPSCARLVLASAWANRLNTPDSTASPMPHPVSLTAMRSRSSTRSTAMSTPPRLVNLTALPDRWCRVWRRRRASVSTVPSASGAIETVKSRPRTAAHSRAGATASSIRARTSMGLSITSPPPRDTSSRSSTRRSMASPHRRRAST